MPSIKVSRADKSIKQIIAATYPEYKGRKVKVRSATRYQMQDYWTEGSRNFAKVYHLETGLTGSPSAKAGIPWETAAHAEIEVPLGVLIVEHVIFCGKDMGITIHAHPDNLAKFLPTEVAA
jgi:hypothetical protein